MYLFGWYIGILGVVIGLWGGWKFFASMENMSGPAKKSFVYLVIAASLYVLFGSLMIILGIMEIELDHILWQVVPLLFVVSTIFFVVGSMQMLSTLKGIKK